MSVNENTLSGIGGRFRTQLCVTAILSVFAGVAGMFLCLLGSLPAVVLGHSALRQIRNSNGKLSGAPLAYAGLVLGYGQLALFALFVGLMFIGTYAAPPEPLADGTVPASNAAGKPEAAGPDASGKKGDQGGDPASASSAGILRILAALASYRRDCGSLPDDVPGLRALMEAPEGVSGWKGPYLSEVPADAWGRPYVYRKSAIGVELFSTGPDGRESGDDIR